jgi:hypothetical protein
VPPRAARIACCLFSHLIAECAGAHARIHAALPDPPVKTADAIVAMDLGTGEIRWTQQATLDMFNWGSGRGGPTGNCPDNAGDDVD